MSFVIVPKMKRDNDPKAFISFEQGFMKFAFPALLAQFLTGPMLAMRKFPNVIDWFTFQSGPQDHIASKIIFIFIIVYLVMRMRSKVMPRMLAGEDGAIKSASKTTHWITFLAFSNVVMGLSVRTDGFIF